MMGTFVGKDAIFLPPKEFSKHDYKSNIPSNFDSRTFFGKCTNVIGHVRDQANCGSCWAFGSTEAFNDRLCIASNGEFKALLSTQDTTSCCNTIRCLSFGCNGGHPGLAWKWLMHEGVVTGSDYDHVGLGDSCWPYELPFCSHHNNSPFPDCDDSLISKTPKCRNSCEEQNYRQHQFKSDKHKAKNSYRLHSVEEIKIDMMENGPVTASFLVYEDILNYKEGIYVHKHGRLLGGHAVKIVGWGEEDGIKYWIVINSWNTYWGAGGTFKIKLNEAGIDSAVHAGKVVWEIKNKMEDVIFF